VIRSREDIPAALRASVESGGLLLEEAGLGPQFFDVRGGLLRELVQKFTSYRARLAVVVCDPSAHGHEFAELVDQHRAHVAVRFFDSLQDARRWLAELPNKKC
jgi:hypothetical protein